MNKNLKYPLIKIVRPGAFLSDDYLRQGVVLECGHEIIVSTKTTYRARCYKCDPRPIAQLAPVAKQKNIDV